MGSAFGDASHGHGTPPLEMSHAMSLPNPDALRAAGVSPGLGLGLHTAQSGSMGASNNAFGANSRVQVWKLLSCRSHLFVSNGCLQTVCRPAQPDGAVCNA
jgi:hypothetical protein